MTFLKGFHRSNSQINFKEKGNIDIGDVRRLSTVNIRASTEQNNNGDEEEEGKLLNVPEKENDDDVRL